MSGSSSSSSEGPSFELVDKTAFVNVLCHMKKLKQQFNLMIGPNGVKTSFMDSSHASLYEMQLLPSFFSKYDCDDRTYIIGLNAELLHKYVNLLARGSHKIRCGVRLIDGQPAQFEIESFSNEEEPRAMVDLCLLEIEEDTYAGPRMENAATIQCSHGFFNSEIMTLASECEDLAFVITPPPKSADQKDCVVVNFRNDMAKGQRILMDGEEDAKNDNGAISVSVNVPSTRIVNMSTKLWATIFSGSFNSHQILVELRENDAYTATPSTVTIWLDGTPSLSSASEEDMETEDGDAGRLSSSEKIGSYIRIYVAPRVDATDD